MKTPEAIRRANAPAKISYALNRHQEVMNALFEAKKAACDPAFLAHTFADIISSARECFDYLGQNIIECHLLAKTSNEGILRAH